MGARRCSHFFNALRKSMCIAQTFARHKRTLHHHPPVAGLGATFNRSVWYLKGQAMSDEMRAFNNLRWYRATGDAPYSLIGLNGYGPNLNIARDPRYGRISELPGEDAFLSGTYVWACHN